MNALFLEPVGGIAGDMFLAACLDVGLNLEALEKPLRSLRVPGWKLLVTKAERHAIVGTHVEVVLDAAEAHPHRAYSEIANLINQSELSAVAKGHALNIFKIIGEAEARIHGVTLEQIHFHEVGAVDSIVDICGAAVALDLLGNPKVFSLPPPLGSGMIRIAHGNVPVPVPATLEILRDCPVKFEGLGELTTPTGAAILKSIATFQRPENFIPRHIGYGAGTKDFKDRANVVRATLGEIQSGDTQLNQLTVFECNLDDCSPQIIAHVMERLLALGALDVWVSPIQMKKSRSAQMLSVLTSPELRRQVLESVFSETTTLGIREYAVNRHALARQFVTVQTRWGAVKVKLGLFEDRVVNISPEFEDCRTLALEKNVPLKDILFEATALAHSTVTTNVS
jgi:pyridinium-3,5-bisthiocarboxylic acid mononucleotide nickel chelatase